MNFGWKQQHGKNITQTPCRSTQYDTTRWPQRLQWPFEVRFFCVIVRSRFKQQITGMADTFLWYGKGISQSHSSKQETHPEKLCLHAVVEWNNKEMEKQSKIRTNKCVTNVSFFVCIVIGVSYTGFSKYRLSALFCDLFLCRFLVLSPSLYLSIYLSFYLSNVYI